MAIRSSELAVKLRSKFMDLTTRPKIKVIAPPSPSMKTNYLKGLMLDPRKETPKSPMRH